MKVSRDFSVAVQYILDEWVPPVLRDAKWFMYLPMKLVFKDHVQEYLVFKDSAFEMTEAEFSGVYERTAAVNELQGETDLNAPCTDEILKSLVGESVLEVGSGRGYLADKMSATKKVTACDIVVPQEILNRFPSITFKEANIEQLPFEDASFDTVVCTHTLEHVQHLDKAISELRRVTRSRLIVVVPRQRPYKYNFSLHINFFPYKWSLVGQFGFRKDVTIKRLGDWYYQEDISPASHDAK